MQVIHLPFACSNIIWIEVSSLKVGEPKLHRSWGIAVWSTEYYVHLQMTNAPSCLYASMVWGTIHQKYRRLSPCAPKLLCHSLCKMWKEHLHDFLVSVALSERQPYMPFRWHCCDHVDSVAHHSIWHGIIWATLVPTSSSEVSRRDPGLINIHNEVTLAVDREHFLCIQTAQNTVPFGVSYEWNPFDFAVAKTKVLLHQAYDRLRRDIKIRLLLDLRFDLLDRPNALLSVQWCFHSTCNDSLLNYALYFFLSLVNKIALSLLEVFD